MSIGNKGIAKSFVSEANKLLDGRNETPDFHERVTKLCHDSRAAIIGDRPEGECSSDLSKLAAAASALQKVADHPEARAFWDSESAVFLESF